MAVTAKKYGKFIVNAFSGDIDWENDTFKTALLTDAYTPDQDDDEFFSDVNTHQASGTGYTAGGETIANTDIIYTPGPEPVVTLDGDPVAWSNSTITARYAVVYKDTGNAATSPLAGFVNFGENKSSDNGTFQITWNVNGIYTITVD